MTVVENSIQFISFKQAFNLHAKTCNPDRKLVIMGHFEVTEGISSSHHNGGGAQVGLGSYDNVALYGSV